MDFSIKTNISNFHEDMLNRALYLVLIGPQLVEVMLTPQGYIRKQPLELKLDCLHLYVEGIKSSVKGTITSILKNCENLGELERNTMKILNETSLFFKSKGSMEEKRIFTSKIMLFPIVITLLSLISKGFLHLSRKK